VLIHLLHSQDLQLVPHATHLTFQLGAAKLERRTDHEAVLTSGGIATMLLRGVEAMPLRLSVVDLDRELLLVIRSHLWHVPEGLVRRHCHTWLRRRLVQL
jgi:hypothetical protein